MTEPRPDLVIRSRQVVLPDGVRAAGVVVREGRIHAVVPWTEAPDAVGVVVDCGDGCLMPGLVDTHVHVNEPGRTEWEGFSNATLAAAAGGITTLVDMPLNSTPATTTVAALVAKRAAAAGACRVDVGFWGGMVPGNVSELDGLAAAGVLGFKCFLVPSGVDDFPHVGERDLREAMPALARLGRPLLVHAELPDPIAAAADVVRGGDPQRYATWLDSRPPTAEVEAIRLVLRVCAETACWVHIVHLSATEALPDLRSARARGLPVTVETCPHYLHFTAEEIADGATSYKCAPPIRERANRECLWEALREGTIDLVASDHSPCPPALKRREEGDFMAAWGGIASLQVALSAVWSEARGRGFTPADLARWMSEGPARLAGLAGRKGVIAPGADADLVVWEPEAEWTVEGSRLHHRHPLTPYEGQRLHGVVRSTFLRGVCVFERGAGGQDADRFPTAPTGRLLERPAVGAVGVGGLVDRGDRIAGGGAVDRAAGSR